MAEVESSPFPGVQKLRRRPALACEQCRRRKVRCDRNLPCSTCVRSKHALCTYAPQTPPNKTSKHVPLLQPASAPGRSGSATSRTETPICPGNANHYPLPGAGDFGYWQTISTSGRSPLAETAASSENCPSSSLTVNSLVERVQQLEQQLSDVMLWNDARDDDNPKTWTDMRGGQHSIRGCVSKTRFFGQSHWMNGVDMLYRVVDFVKKVEHEKNTELYRDLEKCKNLGRVIKARRTPSLNSISIGKHMPARELADALIDAYLRTFETIHRIVHVPTLKADYERYWQSTDERSDAVTVLIQLCMAIGATFYDDKFTLRSSALQWLYEAQFWLISPCEKSKMTITGLQIQCLMHYAKHTANVGSDLTWIGAGSLVRTAMYMGMHRDPKYLVEMSVFRAEMRRRLWATILEILLQSSIDAGGPPLISARDYDTEPPSNLDDTQLIEDAESAFQVPKNAEVYTQMSVPLVLFRTFATRLAVAKRVNNIRANTSFEETLRLSGELTSALQRMMQQLKAYEAGGMTTSFQLRYVQLMTHRLFFALHNPNLPLALRNPVYYFSRKVSVDTAVRLSNTAFLTPGALTATLSPADTDFRRLTVNGAGSWRSILTQSIFIAGIELIHRKEEEHESHGASVAFGGRELRGILEASRDWTASRIRAGETNIKGHGFIACLVAHLDAMEMGCDDDQIEGAMCRVAEVSIKECYDMLGELAGNGVEGEEERNGAAMQGLEMDFEEGVDVLGDWDWDDVVVNPGFSSNFNFNSVDMLLG